MSHAGLNRRIFRTSQSSQLIKRDSIIDFEYTSKQPIELKN